MRDRRAAHDQDPPPTSGTEGGAETERTSRYDPLEGTPATETGAKGADTASADPARGGSGGVQETGEPGPPAEEDPAIRGVPPTDR
jgi:hypothetical protein